MARKRRADVADVAADEGKSLDEILGSLAKDSKGSVIVEWGDNISDLSQPENRISFGNLALDYVTFGGLVRGGCIMLYGEENAGKSINAHLACKHVQQTLKEPCLWVQAPGEVYDANAAAKIGISFSDEFPRVYLLRAATAEAIIDMTFDAIMRAHNAGQPFGLVVVDSIAALRPEDEVVKQSDENPRISGQATLMGRFVTKMASALFFSKRTALLTLNQVRDSQKMVFVGGRMQAEKPKPPGGRMNKHINLGEVRVEKSQNVWDKEGGNEFVVGRVTKYEVTKGKVFGPHGREAEATIFVNDAPNYGFKAGQVDNQSVLLEVAKREGIVTTGGGGWYDILGTRVQGDDQAYALFAAQPDVAAELERMCRERFYYTPEK